MACSKHSMARRASSGVILFYEWKWEDAFRHLQKAIELNPGAMEAYELLGMYYIVMGEKDMAVQKLEEAEKLDPLSPVINQSLGNMYVFSERFDDAIRQANKVLEINPQMRSAIELKGWATAMKGDWKEAEKLFEEVHRLTNHPLKGLLGLGYVYSMTGRKDEAMEVIRKMEQRQAEEPNSVIDADLAGVWYGLEDMDKTFYYLNKCVDKRMGPISYFLEYPAYRGIKNDPRYAELKKRLKVIH